MTDKEAEFINRHYIAKEEADMFHSADDNVGAVLISFFSGAITGAGLALMLALQSGKKTRKQMANMAEDARDIVSGYTKKVTSKIS
ncbi:MAG: YtxH domain-containing protein [Nitrospirota bacterium]|nr:YtxH domain-containing protein [Nitrospirota bacterium]